MTYLLNNNVVSTYNKTDGTLDSFNRLRVSSPEVLFSDKSLYDNTILWDTAITGSGSLDDTNSLICSILDLNVGTELDASVVRQTRQRMIYQPGKSQMILLTGIITQKTNVRSRFGYFCELDGIYLEANSLDMNIVLRSNSTGTMTETIIPQSAWNVDKLDGTGKSKFNIDFNKGIILLIDFEWLGVGIVRVGFVINGQIIYAHNFEHANVLDSTYMGSGTLPVRYEIKNTGTAASSTTLKQICSSVISEGGREEDGILRSINSGLAGTVVGTHSLIPIISIRIDPSVSHSNIEILTEEIINTTNSQLSYKLLFNPTLVGDSWSNGSVMSQYDISATSVSGGDIIDGGFISGKKVNLLGEFKNKVSLGFGLDNTPDVITLAAQSIGGNANLYASVRILERY